MVATKHKPFKFYIKGAGVFGSSYNPKVIWIGIKENKELQKLSMDVLNSMEKIGWARDRQNFVPHLTMGRIKHIADKTKLKELVNKYKDVDIQEENLNEFYLYESILKPQGPIYTILDTFTLK